MSSGERERYIDAFFKAISSEIVQARRHVQHVCSDRRSDRDIASALFAQLDRAHSNTHDLGRTRALDGVQDLVDTLSYALSTAYYHLRPTTSRRMIVLCLTRAVEHAKELERILSGQGC